MPIVIRNWAALGIVILAFSFWTSYVVRGRLISQNRAAQSALTATRPHLINGLRLSFGSNIGTAEAPSVGGRTLLFVSSDDCRFSQAEVAAWIELLNAVKFESRDRAWLVSLSGHDIPTRVSAAIMGKSRGQVSELRLLDPVTFVKATGVSWTPQIVVLDRSGRARLMSEKATPIFVREFHRLFDEKEAIGGVE